MYEEEKNVNIGNDDIGSDENRPAEGTEEVSDSAKTIDSDSDDISGNAQTSDLKTDDAAEKHSNEGSAGGTTGSEGAVNAAAAFGSGYTFSGSSYRSGPQRAGGQAPNYNSDRTNNYAQYGYRQPQGGAAGQAQGGGQYRYSYGAPRTETPKWQADPERYNQQPQPPKPPRPPKRPGRGWIPATIILAVILVIAIVAGSVFTVTTNLKLSALMAQVSDSSNTAAPNDQTIINQNDTSGSSQSQASSGYLLTDVSEIVDEVLPSVVSITSRTLVSSGGWYGYFGNSGSTEEVDSGLGSGTIIGQNDSEVLILTSNHVVDGASSLYVSFGNDVSVDGYTKAYDDVVDIAIVAVPIADIDSETLSYISMAKVSTELPEVGDGVIVIGNALGYGISVTTGTVSALDREIYDYEYGIDTTCIQTDAAINNGNSGGCMLNANGELVGISEAKVTESNAEGMCYAIQVAKYYDQIMTMLETETAANPGSGGSSGGGSGSDTQTAYLGINGADVTEELSSSYGMPQGVYVASVVSGGGADIGGLEPYDIIVALNGAETLTMDALKSELSKYSPGELVTVTVMRADNYGNYSQTTVLVELMSADQLNG